MSRSNTYTTSDVIYNPAFVIESYLRDEVLTERKLTITYVSGTDYRASDLKYETDDYYNGAYFHNVTQDWVALITDYVGATKQLVMTAGGTIAVNDKCFLSNVQANIDTDVFDSIGAGIVDSGTTTSAASLKLIQTGQNFLTTVKVGMLVENTTTPAISYVKAVDSDTQLTLDDNIMASGEAYEIKGVRHGWTFNKVIRERVSSIDELNVMLHDAHLGLFKSYNTYKLFSVGDGTIKGTLNNPLKNPQPMVSYSLTPLDNIYTDFTLNYAYNYAKGIYEKKMYVNSRVASIGYLTSYITVCADAEKEYRVSNKWGYSSDYIYDDDTAKLFLEQKIQWHSIQRLQVEYYGDMKEHIKYECGDKIILDYAKTTPIGINGFGVFIIEGTGINFTNESCLLKLIWVKNLTIPGLENITIERSL